MTGHLASELLLDVALEHVESAREALPHLRTCETCRAELARLRALVAATQDELADSRPGCLTTDELADLPAGAEIDHPHLQECALCREEHQGLRSLDASRNPEFESRPWIRPDPITASGTAFYAAAGDVIELDLEEGAETSGALAGARISLRVVGEELVVTVEGTPKARLRLKLETAVLERRIDLSSVETRVAVRRWKKATVVERAG